ncbi:hypothetical protein KI387_036524, partial [Taxus chinensis]
NKILKVIINNIVNKCVDMLFDISQNKEEYNKFYESFPNNINLAIHEDSQNNYKLVDFYRYHCTNISDEMTSLKDYFNQIKDGYKYIYLITGENKKVVENSPFFEHFKKKGYK